MQQTTRTKRRPVPAGGQRHQDQSDVDRIRSMVKNAPINILCADVDGTIVYANPSSVDTLRQIEHLIPIRGDEVVGTSMDVFHKNPSHQQNLISTDSVMPYSTRISLGDETLDLLLTATYDAEGDYTGPMVPTHCFAWPSLESRSRYTRIADTSSFSATAENASSMDSTS